MRKLYDIGVTVCYTVTVDSDSEEQACKDVWHNFMEPFPSTKDLKKGTLGRSGEWKGHIQNVKEVSCTYHDVEGGHG